MRHLQRSAKAQGPPDASQTVAQPGQAARVLRLHEGVQEEGATHAAFRDPLRGEEACVQ